MSKVTSGESVALPQAPLPEAHLERGMRIGEVGKDVRVSAEADPSGLGRAG